MVDLVPKSVWKAVRLLHVEEECSNSVEGLSSILLRDRVRRAYGGYEFPDITNVLGKETDRCNGAEGIIRVRREPLSQNGRNHPKKN